MMTHLFSLSLALLQAPTAEDTYYEVDYLTPPEGQTLEVGGIGFLSDGTLVCSTRRGQVWMVENPRAKNPGDARFRLFAEGLWEGLGLNVIDDELYVVQRGELSRLSDTNLDGTCDRIDTLSDGWGLSGNYHEFAYGLPVDEAGNFYVSLNVGFLSPKWWLGASNVPYRGWTLQITPEGEVHPFAYGFRSPCGISISPQAELFVTDNQGDWMAASPVFHVEEGGFYGHPASLNWTPEYLESRTLASQTVPSAHAQDGRRPAAIWLPYKWSRSPGNMAWRETDDEDDPFPGQFFLAELTNGMVLRGDFERVETSQGPSELQGWVVPFRRRIGSVVRVAFPPPSSRPNDMLFCGLTNRGWGGLPPADGLARIRWSDAKPFEIQNIELRQAQVSGNTPGKHAFALRFTKPLGRIDRAEVRVVQYDYDYWWEYGSPERETTELAASLVEVPNSAERALVIIDGMEAARVTRVLFSGLKASDGTPLLHSEFAYTVNQLPGAPPTSSHVAKIVPPPPARESDEEGWLRLTWGDATDRWHHDGWELVDAELDPDDPTRLKTTPGVNALTNTASREPSNFVSKPVFGDAQVHVEFMLPKGGRSGVLLHGRYEIVLADLESSGDLTDAHCGALAPSAGRKGVTPATDAYRGPGLLHELDLEFRAPRFDEHGNKTQDAVLLRAMLDDTLLHENVRLIGPSSSGRVDEVAEGPLVLRGDSGPVAFGNVRVRPIQTQEPHSDEGWTPIFDGETLEGWLPNEEGLWSIQDGILVGEGPRSHLFSERNDYRNFEVRARVKISDGGNSGLYVRAQYIEAGWPKGYEAQINSSFADPQKTASLYDLSLVTTHLIASDTWFEYRVKCTDTDAGTRIQVFVNGIRINDFVDTERRFGEGSIALQQHHDGSVIEFERIEVRDAP
jgi:glucose/arabinose dehydrogenase